MAEKNQVVARFINGKTLKGTTDDFYPNKPMFHLYPLETAGTPVEIKVKELKAVFFVKDLEGNSKRRDVPGFGNGTGPDQGKKIAVQFKDGELILGYTLAYTPDRDGFFVLPADTGSNNIRIYVLKHATREVGIGPKAETIAQRGGAKAA